MAAGNSAVSGPVVNALVIERLFNSPRELVFRARIDCTPVAWDRLAEYLATVE
jgi:uncharacterized protein YndB with AHSA1/START domain